MDNCGAPAPIPPQQGNTAGATGSRAPAGRKGGGGTPPHPPPPPPPSTNAAIFSRIAAHLVVAQEVPGGSPKHPPPPSSLLPPPLHEETAEEAALGAYAGTSPPANGELQKAVDHDPPPSPPPRIRRVGSRRVGRRCPLQALCDAHRVHACKSCRGHMGVRHYCSRHHEGHPRLAPGWEEFVAPAPLGGGMMRRLPHRGWAPIRCP